MSTLRTVLAAAAGLTALAVAAPAATAQSSFPSPSSSFPSSSSHLEPHLSTQQHHLGDRSYRVSLPDNFDPQRPYPVILSFGGWTDTAEHHASYAQLHNAVGDDAVVVYGQGVNNGWGGAPYAETTREEDVAYVRDVLADLETRHAIDRSQVFATGLSNGGGMAAGLACQAPDLVAGIVSVVGAHYGPTVADCAAGQVPTVIVHGTHDGLIFYDGGWRHGAYYHSAQEVLGIFGARNGCDMSTVHENHDAVAGSTVLTPANCDAATHLVRVDGGGHTWFTTPNATQGAVDFFRSV